ncbi:MAG: hypothetical protein AAF684_04980 [Pseudomonadota bacterium]
MLAEAVTALLTPASRAARTLGYPAAQAGLAARAKRNRAAWADHLAAARAFVAEAAAQAAQTRTAVILGSGLLDEVPIDALADRFETVICVDVVHPPALARRMRRERTNVKFFMGDVAGMIDRVASVAAAAASAGGPPPRLPESEPRLRLDLTTCDLVVSANLATQLPVLPIKHLRRRLGDAYSVETLDAWSDRIIAAHLAWLRRSFDCPICLFADDWREVQAKDGTVLERRPSLPDEFDAPPPDAEWRWEIAPLGEGPPGERETRWVKGWRDIRRMP